MSNAAFVRARRAEKDSSCFSAKFALAKHRSRYVTPFRTNLADVGERMSIVRSLVGDPQLIEQTVRSAGGCRVRGGSSKLVDLYGRSRHGGTGLRASSATGPRDRRLLRASNVQTDVELLTLRRHGRISSCAGIDR